MIYKRANSIELDLPRSKSYHGKPKYKNSRCATFIERLKDGEDSEFSDSDEDSESE